MPIMSSTVKLSCKLGSYLKAKNELDLPFFSCIECQQDILSVAALQQSTAVLLLRQCALNYHGIVFPFSKTVKTSFRCISGVSVEV